MKKQTNKQDQIVERIKIEDTPFTLVRYEDKYILTAGGYRIANELFQSEEHAQIWMELNKWNVVSIMVAIITERTVKEVMKTQKEQQTTKN